MALWPTVPSDQCPSEELRHDTFSLSVLMNLGVRFPHWWEIFSVQEVMKQQTGRKANGLLNGRVSSQLLCCQRTYIMWP